MSYFNRVYVFQSMIDFFQDLASFFFSDLKNKSVGTILNWGCFIYLRKFEL